MVRNNSDHADEILTVYRIDFPGDCKINGQSRNIVTGLFDVGSDLSSYEPRERKVFTADVLFSCPPDREAALTGSAVILLLEVDHMGDDFAFRRPDDDDNVPANNVVTENKTLE